MWAIRDSDGAETLHSIYPGWAEDMPHLTLISYVPKATADSLQEQLTALRKDLDVAQKFQRAHVRAMKQAGDRMREVESANNRYYAILQRYNLIGALPEQLDDTPMIDVKV